MYTYLIVKYNYIFLYETTKIYIKKVQLYFFIINSSIFVIYVIKI